MRNTMFSAKNGNSIMKKLTNTIYIVIYIYMTYIHVLQANALNVVLFCITGRGSVLCMLVHARLGSPSSCCRAVTHERQRAFTNGNVPSKMLVTKLSFPSLREREIDSLSVEG